jgi:geranylgeranyl pyrophosphate synthase
MTESAGMANETFEDYLKDEAAYIDAKLEEYLAKESSDRYIGKLLGRAGYKYDHHALSKAIFEPAWYFLKLGGKRWRSVLMLLVMEALGKNPEDYIEFSIVPEVIHNATLMHDDIEDGSETRRGSPAMHIKYGLDVANNLGDFLYFFPVVALLDSKKLTTETKNKFLSIYVREMLRVATGQAIDIAWHRFTVDPYSVSEENYLQMVFDKSGVLASMAAQLGGVIAGADDATVKALGKFGATIGVAFQLQDDVLNIYESAVSATKGGVGDDITEGKLTMLVIYTLKHAAKSDSEELLRILKSHTKDKKLISRAIEIIDKYGAKDYIKKLQVQLIKEAWDGIDSKLPESKAKNMLKELAEFLVKRNF